MRPSELFIQPATLEGNKQSVRNKSAGFCFVFLSFLQCYILKTHIRQMICGQLAKTFVHLNLEHVFTRATMTLEAEKDAL